MFWNKWTTHKIHKLPSPQRKKQKQNKEKYKTRENNNMYVQFDLLYDVISVWNTMNHLIYWSHNICMYVSLVNFVLGFVFDFQRNYSTWNWFYSPVKVNEKSLYLFYLTCIGAVKSDLWNLICPQNSELQGKCIFKVKPIQTNLVLIYIN